MKYQRRYNEPKEILANDDIIQPHIKKFNMSDKVYYNCDSICGVGSAARCKNVHCSDHPNYSGKVRKKSSKSMNKFHHKKTGTDNRHQIKSHDDTFQHDDLKSSYKKSQKHSQHIESRGEVHTLHSKPITEKSASSNKRNFQNRYPRRSES